MQTSSAPESFRGLLLRHRGRSGLIQRDLAARAGVSRGAVQDWEAGLNYPTAERLQVLIRVLLEAGGLTVGREFSEARELWAAAERESPRLHAPFDEEWFARLLAARAAPTLGRAYEAVKAVAAKPRPGAVERAQDWGEAPDTTYFVGRDAELTLLQRWVIEERCRLVAILGMGGIGKTSLAAKLAQNVAPNFERVYWRSLRDAPPVSEWLAGAIGFLSDQQVVPPAAESERFTTLLQLLRERRCLLVLDNSETLFEPAQREGRYREGMTGYGRLLQAVGEGRHQSCLVLTSREAPPELAVLGGAVRILELSGLAVDEAQVLLAAKQLDGTSQQWAELNARFGGNGLALKVVGETIREVFGGDIGTFLQEAGHGNVFGGIRRLLTEQVDRGSTLEQQVLRMLAVEREPVRLAALLPALGPRVGRGAGLEAVEALRRRSLVERTGTTGMPAFTLQSVVLEYVTDRLVGDVAEEIERGHPVLLVEQPLIKAHAKEYVRQTQERLIGTPLLQRLTAHHGEDGIAQRLLTLLEVWRGRPPVEQGYAPGNLVNLLRLLRGDLRRLDLSRLALRQAYLAQVDAQDASLVDAHLAETVLAEAFDFPGSVALSGDGALLAAGTSTGQVWLWRVADRTPLWAVQGHTGEVHSVALSHDGQLLVSSGADSTVRLWDTGTGRPVATLQGHTGTAYSVALSADGRLVASGGGDETVRLWDTVTARPVATLQGHTSTVYRVALSADGRLVASGSAEGTVRLWDTGTGRPVATLQGHTGGVWGVALSADGRLVASGDADGTVRLWEVGTGRPVTTLQGHTGTVWGVALSADGRLVASGSAEGTVRLWETGTARPVASLQGHTGVAFSVALSADGQLVASGSADGTVRLWETGTGRPVATLQGHTGAVWGVALSADGRLVASGGGDGTVRLWETRTARPVGTLRGHTGVAFSVALSADGQLVASGSAEGTVRLWDTGTGRPVATLQGHTGMAFSVALSVDGRLVASGGADGTVRLWDTGTVRPVATLQGHTGTVYSVALSADGRLVASGSADGTVRLWDTGTGRLVPTLQGHTGTVYSVALSVDGRLVAGGGGDGTVRLWDTVTGRPVATLQGHTGTVYSVALSADGQLVASGSADGTVRLWDTGTGQSVAALQGHTGAVWGVALSADGQLVASGSFDGTLRLWEASTGASRRILRPERRYERLDITGLTGITAAQRTALLALGAVEQHRPAGEATAGIPSPSAP
jgi:WD40 repeat protein/transcriptional regulator with XRE-family HTH domain